MSVFAAHELRQEVHGDVLQQRRTLAHSGKSMRKTKGLVSCPAPDITLVWFIDTLSEILRLFVSRKDMHFIL